MSMIFYCVKRHLSECNGSWVFSIKQNMNFKFQLPFPFMFLVFHKNHHIESSSPFKHLSAYKNFIVTHWLVQGLHPPQKFECPTFWNGWSYKIIIKYGGKVTFSSMNFIKIFQLFQKLLWVGGTHRWTDRQTDSGDLISHTLLFKEAGNKATSLCNVIHE
jgi:hypothetical protein